MKKIIIGVLVVLALVIATCFYLRITASSKIEAKFEELRENGFNVTYSKKDVPLKIKVDGKLELAYSKKALEYIINNQDEGQLKKSFQSSLKLLSDKEINNALEGATFDFDFDVNLLNSKLSLNIYLTKLSNNMMQELLEDEDKAANVILEMLKNRDFQITIDENKKYRVKDINFVLPEGTATIRGISGDNKLGLNIDLFKISSKEDEFTLNSSGLKLINEEKDEVLTSKMSFENIDIVEQTSQINIKNFDLLSISKMSNGVLSGDTEISFEKISSKSKEELDFELLNSSAKFSLNNFPYDSYIDFLEAIALNEDSNKLAEKTKLFLETISKAGVEIKLDANSKDLIVKNQKMFQEFDLKSNFILSKKLNEMKFENINDIFELANIELKTDSKSFDDMIKQNAFPLEEKIKILDSEDKKYKILKLELKEDGLYTNGVLAFKKDELKFQQNNISDDILDDNNTNLSYSYKMLDKDTLRVNFKYKSSLEAINSGGISVSFPELKDDSLIKAKSSKNFANLDVYKKGDALFSGLLNKNVTASYLMIEGFDENWSDLNIEKEFSLDIDVSKLDDYLEINLRGYSSNEKGEYELVPTENSSATNDQQTYFVKIADIDLEELKSKFK